MITRLYTAPAVEPVTLEEAKNHLRVDLDDDDSLIESLVRAAREHAEVFTGRALISQTWEAYLDEWPKGDSISLPYPPLKSVTGVYYTGTDGNETELAGTEYAVDTVSIKGRVVLKSGKSWPSAELGPLNPIRIRFVAGYGDTALGVPEGIRSAIKLILGTLYQYRETIIIGTIVSEMPMAIDSLLWPYRVKEF